MSVSGTASGRGLGFMEFDDLCRGCHGYSYNLAELFDKCAFDKSKQRYHSISFKESLERLKGKIKDSFKDLETQTERKVTAFTIGKTFAKSRSGREFDTMNPHTWKLDGGINGRWQDYKDDYNGLIVIGCIERDLIPKDVKDANKQSI